MKKTFYNIRNIDGQVIGTIDELKQDAQIKIWLQRCGLTMNDLNNHPYIEDINFLLEIRKEFQQEIDSHRGYKGTFAAYWDIVVNRQQPLKDKAFKKFQQLVQGCILLREQHNYKINKIKSLRQTRDLPKQNMDHDMAAKGSCSPELLLCSGTMRVMQRISN
jgi:hypothetical protein